LIRPSQDGNFRKQFREEEKVAFAQYESLLTDLVVYRVQEIYRAETLEQRPPWMAPRPLARLRYQLPATAEKLAHMVKKQVGGCQIIDSVSPCRDF
jgi:hypothetical protein